MKTLIVILLFFILIILINIRNEFIIEINRVKREIDEIKKEFKEKFF